MTSIVKVGIGWNCYMYNSFRSQPDLQTSSPGPKDSCLRVHISCLLGESLSSCYSFTRVTPFEKADLSSGFNAGAYFVRAVDFQ